MDPDSGKLYSQEEVEAMTAEERKKLTWISRREYNYLQDVPEDDRPKELKKIRSKAKKAKKKKRKQARASRKKNR